MQENVNVIFLSLFCLRYAVKTVKDTTFSDTYLPIRLFVPIDYLHFTPLIFIQEMNIPLSIKSKIKDTSFLGAFYFGPLIIT